MDLEFFKEKLLAYCEQNKDSEELKKKVALRDQFNEEFPIEVLREMTLAEYAIGRGDRNTFCYLLERGRYKTVGVGIGGDTALKFGIYFSKTDNSYQIREFGKAHKTAEDPEGFWGMFRDELCGFLEKARDGVIPDDFKEIYPDLNGLGLMLNKLTFLYSPQKFLNVTNKTASFVFDIFNEPELNKINRVIKPALLWEKLRQLIPEISSSEYDPQLIGDGIFEIFRGKLDDEPSRLKGNPGTDEEQESIIGGKNEIYYGTPGCGKSYLVEKKYGDESNEFGVSIRTVFHPDYTNSDFVGQVVPTTTEDGAIRYEFIPGPFTEALCEAMKNPSMRVSLIIDEINRGNASAIFGDIIQLLDRNSKGESMYAIHNKAVSDYLNRKEISSAEEDIFLPSNLWLVGTMNTSDQNVFPLDTAFKRRWIMHKIRNSFNGVDSKLANSFIPGSNVKWREFVEKINRKITHVSATNLDSEDKQIGVYFVDKDMLSNTPSVQDGKKMAFAEKVLMYIWEDVARLNRSEWFGDEIKSLDELLDKYERSDRGGLEVFNGIDFDGVDDDENS